MYFSQLLLPALATLSLASAAVIPPNTVEANTAVANSQSTATTLDHCIELLTAHNNEGTTGVPTVSAEVSAAVEKCGRCLNTADIYCGQKGFTKPAMISDNLMQCYVGFWPKSKCAA